MERIYSCDASEIPTIDNNRQHHDTNNTDNLDDTDNTRDSIDISHGGGRDAVAEAEHPRPDSEASPEAAARSVHSDSDEYLDELHDEPLHEQSVAEGFEDVHEVRRFQFPVSVPVPVVLHAVLRQRYREYKGE